MADDLDTLQRKIDVAKTRETSHTHDKAPDVGGSAFGPAINVAVEFIAGSAVGGGIGYFIDRWLGTSPAFLVVCFFLGFAAAGFRMMRECKRNNKLTRMYMAEHHMHNPLAQFEVYPLIPLKLGSSTSALPTPRCG